MHDVCLSSEQDYQYMQLGWQLATHCAAHLWLYLQVTLTIALQLLSEFHALVSCLKVKINHMLARGFLIQTDVDCVYGYACPDD